MTKLSKLEEIQDLREIWPHEAREFTPWLAQDDNIKLLGDAIGLDIEVEETKSSVCGLSVDIYASEEGSERKIIIENQLEETNHDHLGKLITYASGKSADVLIWIVKKLGKNIELRLNGSTITQMKALTSFCVKSNYIASTIQILL